MRKRLLLFTLPILFVIFALLFTFSTAFANIVKTGFLSLVDLVHNSVVLQVKDNVCNNYLSSFSDKTQWPDDSLRTSVAIKSCQDIELAKIEKFNKSSTSTDSYSDYNLSTASSSKSSNNFYNSFKVEVVDKAYPKTISNTPIISAQSSSTKTEISPNIESIGVEGISNYDIIKLTNIERQKKGVKILKENSLLDKIAKERLEDMFRQGYFEHISPQGTSVSDIAKTDGYDYLLIGENIALGNFKSSVQLVTAWMESPGHKENILNPQFLEIGVFAKEGSYNGTNMIIGVQIFGNPSSSCSYPDANLKTKIETEINEVNGLVTTSKRYIAELEALDSGSGTFSSDYNNKASEYNVLVKKIDALYTEIKDNTDIYNAQVKVYNSCISLIK